MGLFWDVKESIQFILFIDYLSPPNEIERKTEINDNEKERVEPIHEYGISESEKWKKTLETTQCVHAYAFFTWFYPCFSPGGEKCQSIDEAYKQKGQEIIFNQEPKYD